MPNWKKVLTSGSAGELASLFATSITGSLQGTASFAISASRAISALSSSFATTASYALTASYSQNLQISGSINNVDYIDFNESAGVTVQSGQLAWNSSDGTLDLGLKGGNVTLQLGQETLYEVRNATGVTISNGTSLYASGVTAGSGRIEASPFIADGSVREVRFLGLATEDIGIGVNGFVTHFGYTRNLDTRGTSVTAISIGDENWSVGDILYAHPTAAGKLTNVKPKHEISVAIVIVRNQTTGVLFVRPSSFGHLEDNHDVNINTGSLSTGDLLIYDSGSDYWTNSRQLTGSYGITGSLSITGSTSTDLVRITQTGTGNAFVVEDSTNPDSTPFVITTAGNVGIGTTTPSRLLSVNGVFGVQYSNATESFAVNPTSTGTDFVIKNASDPTLGEFRVDTRIGLRAAYYNGGNFAIGSSADDGINKLQVIGSARITNGLVVTSSLTVKGTGAVGAVLDTDTSSDFQSTRLFFKMSGSGNDVSMRNLSGSLLVATQATAGGSSGTVTAMFISSSGNVAIGNTQPTLGLLQVGGNVYATSFTGSGLQITGSTTTDLVRITQTGAGNAFVVEDESNPDSTPFVITAAGNVGIGTNAPSELLSIQASDVGTNLANDGVTLNIANSNSTANNISSISFGQSGAGGNGFSRIGAIYKSRTAGAEAQDLFFGTINAGAFGERMRITSDGKVGIGTSSPNAKLDVSGSVIITGSLNVTQNITGSRLLLSASTGTNSGSVLTVYGSGSAQPVFTVQGSQGELFSVTDSLSGSLFSVNDISGLPILEVFSDNTTLIGSYQDPMLITTTKLVTTASGAFTIYSLPTASYDTAFFEYSIRSGSNARAGSIMAIQSASAVNFTETTTTDFGSTAGLAFTVLISGANMLLTGSATTSGWTLKTIIRSI